MKAAALKLKKIRTIKIRLTDRPEDKALYAALVASRKRECRSPLSRHVKWQLKMAMGLRQPDGFLLKRLGFSDVEEFIQELTAGDSPEKGVQP